MKRTTLMSILLLSMVAFTTISLISTAEPAIDTMDEAPGYFVLFPGNKLPENAETIIEECGGTVTHKFPKIGVLTALPIIDPIAFEGALAERTEIQGFEHDYIVVLPETTVIPVDETTVQVDSDSTVTDPYYWKYQWHLWHTIEASPSGAWSITTGDPNIKVAVLDTGIDYLHGDISPNYDFALSTSFVPYEDEMDYHGHGTWCGGMVAAAINNNPDDWKVVGVGPTLTLVNLKVMDATGGGYFSWVVAAVYYAVANGIDVISMSLGGYLPMSAGAGSFYGSLNRVFNYAQQNGIVCVGSAGNQGWDMDWVHAYYIHVPSQCSGVIDAIATDIYDGLATYSNYGSTLHGISAPGGDYAFVEPSWYEDTIPPADWRYWYGLCYNAYAWTATGYRYAWYGGTSQAAPHIAGVAGLILSVNPRAKPSQVLHFLKKGAVDIGDPGYDQYFNFGLLNAYNSLTETLKWRANANSMPADMPGVRAMPQ